MNFQQRLIKLNINPQIYLSIVKEIAEHCGYNPDNLNFSDTICKKLMYRHNGRTIHFGNSMYQDYIILNSEVEAELITTAQCDEMRNRYLLRVSKIKSDWMFDDYSPKYLNVKLLWAYED